MDEAEHAASSRASVTIIIQHRIIFIMLAAAKTAATGAPKSV